ncbi:MAG: 2-amino-4-hydroxy-6-hydroxymethyldihydropteridine diphosphokinase [Methylotetracoccus sp.]
MPEVFVGIGTNIDRERNLASALQHLSEAFGTLRCSSVYETEAVGFVGDPFLNLVVSFETELSVPELVGLLADIERGHGRQRDSRKFAARTLDLDLLLYGDTVVRQEKLRIPREEITRYAFVLEPLAELAPDHRHPVLGISFARLWSEFDKTHVRQHRIPFPANA